MFRLHNNIVCRGSVFVETCNFVPSKCAIIQDIWPRKFRGTITNVRPRRTILLKPMSKVRQLITVIIYLLCFYTCFRKDNKHYSVLAPRPQLNSTYNFCGIDNNNTIL